MARLKIIVDDGNVYPKVNPLNTLTDDEKIKLLTAHRILVNGWSFDKVTRFGLYDAQRLRSLYKMIDGNWTEDRSKAHFYHWNGKPNGNFCADVRYETYWLVDGIEYNNYNDAFEALYNELFIKPAVPMLIMELADNGVL